MFINMIGLFLLFYCCLFPFLSFDCFISRRQLTKSEILQLTGKTLRPFMRPPANVSAACIHYYVTHTVSFTFVMEHRDWPMPQSPHVCFPTPPSSSTMGLLSVQADNPSHQLLIEGVNLERVDQWKGRREGMQV